MSVTQNVKNKIQDHLEAMDDGAGNLRFNTVATIPILDQYTLAPYAEIFFGSGEFIPDVNGTLDFPLTMVIRVTFDDEDLAATIWEEMIVLWFSNTNFTELSALGVVNLIPLDAITPVVLPGGERYIMDVKYALTIRYTY